MSLKRIYIDRKSIKENDLRDSQSPSLPCITIDNGGELSNWHEIHIKGASWIIHPDDKDNHHNSARLWLETYSEIIAHNRSTGMRVTIS